MNKKFMVIALMAALSTVGYAEWHEDPTNGGYIGATKGTENFKYLKGETDRLNQANIDMGNLVTKIQLDKADKTQVENLTGRVEKVEGLSDRVDEIKKDFDYTKADLELKDKEHDKAIEDLTNNKADKTQVENLTGRVDEIKKDFDYAKAESELKDKEHDKAIEDLTNNKADKTQVENLTGRVDEIKKDFDYAKAESELKDKEHDKAIADLDKNKADKDYVDGKVTELGDHVREEMDTVRGEIGGVKAEVYENKEAIAANKAEIERVDKENKDQQVAIDRHEDQLNDLQGQMNQYDGRLSGLEKKVDHLDDKMNKGLSLMAAMNAVDFQNVQTGEMALGAGIGHYGNAQSVALGVAYSPVQDLTVNAKYSVTAGDVDSFALGAGATYKFKVGR